MPLEVQPDRVEIHIDKPLSDLRLALKLLPVAGVITLLASWQMRDATLPQRILFLGVGVAMILAPLLRRLERFRKPLLTFSTRGIATMRHGLLPWSDISRVFVFDSMGNVCLGIERRQATSKLGSFYNRLVYGYDALVFDLAYSQTDLTELIRALKPFTPATRYPRGKRHDCTFLASLGVLLLALSLFPIGILRWATFWGMVFAFAKLLRSALTSSRV